MKKINLLISTCVFTRTFADVFKRPETKFPERLVVFVRRLTTDSD